MVARSIVSAALILAAHCALGEEIRGKVIRIADGDTLTILDVGKNEHKIRLVGIDAPEKKQPFGNRSKQSLSDLTFGKMVRVVTHGKDRYGRALGRVYVGQQDVNAEQVRRGMAWVFKRYAPKNSPLYQLEAGARAAQLGIWSDPNPVAPWEWRQKRDVRR